MILLIDNYDSFTFNLVHFLGDLGAEVEVWRNDAITPEAALARKPEAIVLSPGPCTPNEAGVCLDLIAAAAKERVPLLGVCLGHQAIVHQAGGRVTRADAPVHGKANLLHHDGAGPFAGIEEPVRIGRYHSLCTRDLPARFTIHAHVEGMAMAISDPAARQTGLQFHPESILTTRGDTMLANILVQSAR
jgi:anthranilate synthase/aminodeoxychorismate synthase-like glutamine amidotransferase